MGHPAYLLKPVKQAALLECLMATCAGSQEGRSSGIVTREALNERRHQRKYDVLIVEDNAINQEIALAMLNKLDCRCEVASNGLEAVAALERRSYELVFMDCQMPEMDGYEATRRIRSLPGAAARVPIVAMTANAMKGDRERCLEAGMDDYVSKPIKLENLAEAVARQLGSPRITSTANTTGTVGVGNENVFGYTELLEKLGGDEDLLTTIIGQFLQTLDENLRVIETASLDSDASWDELERAAHTLKGSAANLGAYALSGAAGKLDAAVRFKRTDDLAPLRQTLRSEAEALRAATCHLSIGDTAA